MFDFKTIVGATNRDHAKSCSLHRKYDARHSNYKRLKLVSRCNRSYKYILHTTVNKFVHWPQSVVAVHYSGEVEAQYDAMSAHLSSQQEAVVCKQCKHMTTHDHISFSQIQDSSNSEGHIPIFIYSRYRVARLYSHAHFLANLLLNDVAISKDPIENTVPSGTSAGFVAWHDMFYCCATVYCAIA
jgi:hypothetical protein